MLHRLGASPGGAPSGVGRGRFGVVSPRPFLPPPSSICVIGEAAPSGDGMRDALALHRTVLAGRLQLLGNPNRNSNPNPKPTVPLTHRAHGPAAAAGRVASPALDLALTLTLTLTT